MMNEFMHAASAYRENYVRSQMCLRAQVILVCCANLKMCEQPVTTIKF